MKLTGPFFALLALVFSACQPSTETLTEENTKLPFLAPDQLLGQLFVDVQMNQVFPDGKTFVDCTPKSDPAKMLEAYLSNKGKPGFDLKAFVLENFDLPPQPGTDFKSDLNLSAEEHILALWPILTRQPDAAAATHGSLIPLPNPYIVPGGRFREVYYWDSYFTMLGLQVAGNSEMIEHMLDNFAYLIDTIGFIPNGNRTYYLGRSQPPFFSLMVGVLAEMKGDQVYQKYLPQLEKEYAFWMEGVDALNATKNPDGSVPAVLTHRRVVKLMDGSVLNRYWDDRETPRPESYREDVLTAQQSGRPVKEMYRQLRAGAESGWDFSSRWLADGLRLETIHTTEIAPIDLNALLYHLEFTLAQTTAAMGNQEKGKFYIERAKQRMDAVHKHCWDAKAGFFLDFDFVKNQPTYTYSIAGMYPLFFKMATPDQAARSAIVIEKKFLQAGGVVCTEVQTGQQWDAPNGWAPLQWMTIKGLQDNGHKKLSDEVAKRWIDLNTKVYKRTGKMNEKYNVKDLSLEAGGGEYPVQDGFGWTNGVLLRLLSDR